MTTFYLSSTYEDLKGCREAVCKALRQMGHQVEGMESYTADGRAPLKKCLEDVALCDVYVGIFARRYGYVPAKDNPERKSITELEYREALRLGKEVLIFILSPEAMWREEQEDEEQIKRLRRLREELRSEHTVSFFVDCNHLASEVTVAASRIAKVEPTKAGPEPLPPPPPPPPPPWKRYALAAAVVTLASFAAYYVYVAYSPDERVNQWSVVFNKAEKLDDHWDYPKGAWSTEPGEAVRADQDDEALLVKGQEMGVPNDLGGKVFCDFTANFKVRFKSGGTKGAWVLRAQSDRESGYLFELTQEGARLYLSGYVYDGKQKQEDLGRHQLPFGLRRENQSLFVEMTVEGDKLNHSLTFEDEEPDDTSGQYDGQPVDFSFEDHRWPCGTFGLLVPDDTSVMRVEYIYIYPQPRKR